jgi:hypothetical protein
MNDAQKAKYLYSRRKSERAKHLEAEGVERRSLQMKDIHQREGGRKKYKIN